MLLFVLGLVVLGVALARVYQRMLWLYREYQKDAAAVFDDSIEFRELLARDKARYSKRHWLDRSIPYASFALFILGYAVGGWALFSAEVSSVEKPNQSGAAVEHATWLLTSASIPNSNAETLRYRG